jgi:hypothetical protein
MPIRPWRWAVAFAVFATVSIAHGQVYKCTGSNGTTIYADAPCDAGSKPLKLESDPLKSASDPNMCRQLLDETRRLAAEADRDARRGRPVNTSSAKRRASLTRTYESRCVRISIEASKAK